MEKYDEKSMSEMQRGTTDGEFLSEQGEKERLDMQGLCQSGIQGGLPQGQSLEEIQREVVSWADRVFPDRTLVNTFMKLHVEISELIEGGLKDPKEYADLIILAVDMAHLADIHNISEAVANKMQINRERAWGFDPVSGTYQHVEGYVPESQEDDGYTD
jgi:hypothetical protein